MREIHRELFSGLEAVKEKNPMLAGVVDLQRELLEASTKVQPSIPGEKPSTGQIRAALQQGIPLLQMMRLDLDFQQFAELYRQVCQISARHRPDLAEDFIALKRQLEEQPEELHAAISAGFRVPKASEADQQEEENELLSFVLLHALRPFLQARAERLVLDQVDELWQKGFCPVCAGWPDLAYLEDKSRSRRLVCERCDTSWRFPRVKCPYCGTADPSDLAYYPGQDEKYRLYVCNCCKRYLKTLDTTYTGVKVTHPVERVVTLAMDLAAQEAGYL